MDDTVQKAYDELRNAVWMLVIILCLMVLTIVGGCQMLISERELEDRLGEISNTSVVQEVEETECAQPKPVGDGHICAQNTEWWSPIEGDTSCIGGQCYAPAWQMEIYTPSIPVFIPGLLPLIFLFIVMRKIVKARRFIQEYLRNR